MRNDDHLHMSSHPVAPQLDHVLVIAANPPTTLRFLTEVVGLVDGARPAFGLPGWWLYARDQAVVHVVQGAPTCGAGDSSDAIHHVAFRLQDRNATRERLRQGGWRYSEAVVPQTGELQIFVSIPGGLLIELVFDADSFPPD